MRKLDQILVFQCSDQSTSFCNSQRGTNESLCMSHPWANALPFSGPKKKGGATWAIPEGGFLVIWVLKIFRNFAEILRSTVRDYKNLRWAWDPNFLSSQGRKLLLHKSCILEFTKRCWSFWWYIKCTLNKYIIDLGPFWHFGYLFGSQKNMLLKRKSTFKLLKNNNKKFAKFCGP